MGRGRHHKCRAGKGTPVSVQPEILFCVKCFRHPRPGSRQTGSADEYERNDCIYIVRNRGGIYAENLSLILKRNDIKKSEAYESGYLEGTVPVYEAYMALKKVLSSVKIEEDEEEND